MRTLARGLGVVTFAMLALGAGAQAAEAHAELVGSDPAGGAVLSDPPATVRLWFNEEISPDLSTATLVDASGRTLPGTRAEVDASDPQELILAVPSLQDGGYGVLWQVLAEDDGHTTSGAVVFSIGTSSSRLPAVPLSTDGSSPLIEIGLRWLGFFLLAVVVGGLAVSGLVLRRALADPRIHFSARRAQGRILSFAFSCARAAVVVSIAVLLEEAVRVASPLERTWWTTGIADVLVHSRWGHLWIARELALIGLAIALCRMASTLCRHDGEVRRGTFVVSGSLVLAIVWIQALGSHAAALDVGRTMAIAADAVHLLTACLWLGALPALILILRSGGADEGGRTALIRACARPFSWLAATSVCLVTVTGLYSAGRQVDTVERVTSTTYGHALLVKVALLVLAVGLGAVNATRLHGWRVRQPGAARLPAADRSLSPRMITLEALVGFVILLVVGMLTATPPARGPVLASARDATWTGGGTVDDLVVSLSVSPNRSGVNGFTVVAASSRRPPPAPIDRVALGLRLGSAKITIPLHEVEPGTYFGTATLGASGTWRMTTLIGRAGDRLVVPFGWSVQPAASPRSIPPEGRRLAPIVDALAVALLTIASVGAALLLVRRSRRAGGRGRRGGPRPVRPPIAEPVDVKIPEVVS